MGKANTIQKFLTIAFITSLTNVILAQNLEQQNKDIKIFFDDSAARYVLENPEKALNIERDSIWKSFEGYRITLVWHEKSSVPVTWKVWERGLNKFLYQDTSLIKKSLTLADSLKSKVNREQNTIVQHISSYSYEKTKINAFIYFVAFTIPYAFCVDTNKIGIDITGSEWNFDTDCILNTVIHEIYHIAYKLNSPDYFKYIANDPIDRESFVRFNYAYLQSEGMATFVAYKALNLFPSDYRHPDYELLENDSTVKIAIHQINLLSEMAMTMPLDTLLQECWKMGVEQRAYYIAGGYVAKIIEEKYGTEFLAALVKEGSISFVKKYNMLVPDDYKLVLLEL
jgi:hypothetical protein